MNLADVGGNDSAAYTAGCLADFVDFAIQFLSLRHAKKDLHSLFAMQEDDGFVGHLTFWRELIPTHYSDVLPQLHYDDKIYSLVG